MERYREILAESQGPHWPPVVQKSITAVGRYLEIGDEKSLQAALIAKDLRWLFINLLDGLQRNGPLDEYDRRLLRLMAACDVGEILFRWVEVLADGGAADATFLRVAEAMRGSGFTEAQIDVLSLRCSEWARDASGALTAVGQRITGMSQKAFTAAVAAFASDAYELHRPMLALVDILRDRPDRASAIIAKGRKTFTDSHFVSALLERFGETYEPMAADIFRKEGDLDLGLQLLASNRERYHADVVACLPKHLENHGWYYDMERIVAAIGPMAVPLYADYLVRHGGDLGHDFAKFAVPLMAKHGGEQAKPALLRLVEESESPALRAMAVEKLLAMNEPQLLSILENAIEKGMDGDARDAARFAVLAAQFAGGRLRDRLWKDLAAKAKVRREAAATAIAAGDPAALDRAAGMSTEKSKEARLGAVVVLGKLATPEAINSLLNWLPREETEEVRDEVARQLRQAGVSLETIIARLGPADLGKLKELAAKVKSMPVTWLGMNDLPPLNMLDGEPMDPLLVRYLLHRQSRQKEAIIDPEAAPLYGMIDRRTSGDFAWALLSAFLAADAPKDDAWAMIPAAVLGDNRVITTLVAKVRGWAQDFALKLGEWGIEALAINGSDAALSAVESIATKFKDNPRRKFKEIGEAAQNALELAAKRSGITMDELGDRIVPAMGFEPGRPRRIEAGKRTIEATIGLDFKLSMVDVATGKKAVSIPKTAAPEVVTEFKGLGKLLLEVAKSQATRLEGRMIAQYRWPGRRWRELFLQHPMLFPFAVRLVWATYGAGGVATATFRALPDRSLTDAGDESVDPPADDVHVGIAHPLDLSPGALAAWQTHLSDYEIEQPFAQVDRPVMRLAEALRQAKSYDELKGASLNALAFRSKAEKAGWTRAGTGDGGYINAYRKRFATAGLDAYVTVDGVPAYTDPAAQCTIGTIFFAPIDATAEDFTQRQLQLSDVPAMVYSEAVGDMTRISGKLLAT